MMFRGSRLHEKLHEKLHKKQHEKLQEKLHKKLQNFTHFLHKFTENNSPKIKNGTYYQSFVPRVSAFPVGKSRWSLFLFFYSEISPIKNRSIYEQSTATYFKKGEKVLGSYRYASVENERRTTK